MKLNRLLDIDRFIWLLDNRFVSAQTHPELDLKIFNYTHKAQYDSSVWVMDDTISYCRGLVVNRDSEIVARPFKKFWNLNTSFIPESQEANLPSGLPTITEKLDGSLGILVQYDGQQIVATRGSFTSPQALWATKWLNAGLDSSLKLLPSDKTWLFEIIYDENRIVLSYPFEALVILGAVDPETGAETQHELVTEIGRACGYRVVRQIRNRNLKDLIAENKKGEEGYVVTYSRGAAPPLKVKIKFEDYCRVHKIVTGTNPRSIWELLKADQDLDSLIAGHSEEFQVWVAKWRTKLETAYSHLICDLVEIHANRPFRIPGQSERDYRKSCALYFEKQNRSDLKSAYFTMLSGEDPREAIWDLIEPRGDDKSFRVEGE